MLGEAVQDSDSEVMWYSVCRAMCLLFLSAREVGNLPYVVNLAGERLETCKFRLLAGPLRYCKEEESSDAGGQLHPRLAALAALAKGS